MPQLLAAQPIADTAQAELDRYIESQARSVSSLPQYITHPQATDRRTPSARYTVTAHRFQNYQATGEVAVFDVLTPCHLATNAGIARLLKTALNSDWLVTAHPEAIGPF